MRTIAFGAACSTLLTAPAFAEGPEPERVRVRVTLENLAPRQGTFLTPLWVGFHEGQFDTYDGLTPASSDPRPGSVAMERICEDGDTAALTSDFALLSKGVDATVPGPSGPIAPGDITGESFLLDPASPDQRYFSYASMIIPSNDFCISNGSPLAHPVFDGAGKFVAEDFIVAGSEVLDAGTEVNDEVPANTAFFGQAAPDTGVDEGGLIGTLGSDLPAVGFAPKGSGGILDDFRFRMADFLKPGYPVLKVGFAVAPAIVDDLDFVGRLRGRGYGFASWYLRDQGTRLRFTHIYTRLRGVTGAGLYWVGPSGPVLVADLLPEGRSGLPPRARRALAFYFEGELSAADLIGPFAGKPLDALVQAMKAGDVEVRITTRRAPDGALRARLEL
jgi:hypothetical protein